MPLSPSEADVTVNCFLDLLFRTESVPLEECLTGGQLAKGCTSLDGTFASLRRQTHRRSPRGRKPHGWSVRFDFGSKRTGFSATVRRLHDRPVYLSIPRPSNLVLLCPSGGLHFVVWPLSSPLQVFIVRSSRVLFRIFEESPEEPRQKKCFC